MQTDESEDVEAVPRHAPGYHGSQKSESTARAANPYSGYTRDDRMQQSVDGASASKMSHEQVRASVENWRPAIPQHFPFVSFRPEETTDDILGTRPFLSRSIAVAASFGDLPKQIGFALDVIQDLSHHMMIMGEKVRTLEIDDQNLLILTVDPNVVNGSPTRFTDPLRMV